MSRSLPERVAGLYYVHGLFCSSHPFIVLSIAFFTVLLCSLPLVNLPVPAVVPRIVINNATETLQNLETSVIFVQQVSLKVAVIPWSKDLSLSDGFRGPLHEVFNLLELIQNFEDLESSKSLSQVCLHVEAVKKMNSKRLSVLPEYNCLILSPANFWQQSIDAFNRDTNLIETVFSYEDFKKGKISTIEMMFGMNLKETGMKRHPLRVRSRVIQYAVTLFLKKYDPVFLKGLKHRLTTYYPLYQSPDKNKSNAILPNETLHIYYPSEFNYRDFFPFTVALVVLFFYVYFSVRKIEAIKSKFGIAFCATITVVASLLVTIGTCCFFGLTLTLNAKEAFPYLIMIVGLENVLVLTKSVVSTPAHLDLKIRVAQGLSREGWSITKNLLIEVTILTMGLITFVPAIQEFCIFAIVGLLSDFFLQMVLFSTTLAYDMREKEMSKQNRKLQFDSLTFSNKQKVMTVNSKNQKNIFRSKSHPKLNESVPIKQSTNVIAYNDLNTVNAVKIPKRLKVVHFWARTRIFQRAFMVWMVVWISIILYNSGIIEQVIYLGSDLKVGDDPGKYPVNRSQPIGKHIKIQKIRRIVPSTPVSNQVNKQELNKLRPVDFSPWSHLSTYHWPTILSSYNISVAGERLIILPTIKLSHAITPEFVKQVSNPNDEQLSWLGSYSPSAFDPLDFSDIEISSESSYLGFDTGAPFIPSSPTEIFLATLLCIVSFIVVTYTMIVLYRCICSRNYPEWRASWSFSKEKSSQDAMTQFFVEEVPVVLDGHTQDVEFIVTDGNTIASSCLDGHVKVWDSTSGEQLVHIDRHKFFSNLIKEIFCSAEKQNKPESNDHNVNNFSTKDEMSSFDSLKTNSTVPRNRFLSQNCNNIDDNLISLKNNLTEMNTNSETIIRHNLLQQNSNETSRLSDFRLDTKFSLKKSLPVSPNQKDYKNGYNFQDSYKQFFENRDQTSFQNENIRQRKITSHEIESNFQVEKTNLAKYMNSVSTEKIIQLSQEASSIWCVDYQDNLIVIGCANGSVEFWEGTTGNFKYIFNDESELGISAIKLSGKKVVVAKLNGVLDFLLLENDYDHRQIDQGFNSFRQTHVRTGSAGSPRNFDNISQSEDFYCMKIYSCKAHQQAITVLDVEGDRILTGSQDHTVKVFRLEDHFLLYTLHGHCGPITCLFIDRVCPMTSGSGSKDGLLCVWDLATGTCMYNIQAHDGAVASITCSASYVISIGADEKLCVWERFQGHLLHSLPAQKGAYSLQLAMLTHHLLITSNQASLIVWDVRTGEPIREVRLGSKNSCTFVKQLLPLRDSIICDFGRQIKIVRFPLVSTKID